MKTSLVALLMAFIFPLTGFAFFGGHDGARHEKHLDKMAQELNLTDVQKKQVEAIFKEQGEKMKATHDETHARLAKVLTPEQVKKMDDLRRERQEKWAKKWHDKKAGKSAGDQSAPASP